MTIVAEQFDFVVGIDTHARTHSVAIICTTTGEELATDTSPATTAGINRALSWISRRTNECPGSVLLSMEGTGSYGAKFRQQATEADFRVAEAPFPERRVGRLRGKSDAIDAVRAARATLGLLVEKLREPAPANITWPLRALTVARDSMARQRTAAINSLTALLRVVELGIDARRP